MVEGKGRRVAEEAWGKEGQKTALRGWQRGDSTLGQGHAGAGRCVPGFKTFCASSVPANAPWSAAPCARLPEYRGGATPADDPE